MSMPNKPVQGQFYPNLQTGSRCIYADNSGDFPIAVYLDKHGNYMVQYGFESHGALSYREAARHLGEMMMHSIHLKRLDALTA